MAEPPTETPHPEAGGIDPGVLAFARMLMAAGQSGVGGEFSGPVDPLHPEKGSVRYRMSELEMSLYNEKDPEKLKAALRRGIDVLDGIPDVLHTGDTPLIMNSFVNPEVKPLQSAEYGLYVVINSRLEKAAADLRTRAESAGVKEKPDTAELMRRDMEAVKTGKGDPQYKDPLVWLYLKEKKERTAKAADAEKISVGEYEKKHPEVLDPEVALIREGIWAEFQARERLHNAWVDRMTTTGSSDNQRGAARLFVDPNHTDIKAPDWYILFRDEALAEHEDEAMRAMVDVALGQEMLWKNKKTPGDLSVARKEMWQAMLERRVQNNPDVLRDLRELARRPGFEKKSPLQTKEALKQKIKVYGDLKRAYERELEALSEKMDPRHGKLAEAMTKMAGTIPSGWTTLRRDERDLFVGEIPEFDPNERTGVCFPRIEATLAEYTRLNKYFEWKNPYPDNFKTSEVFGEWFDYVLSRADGDLRAVYLAWRKFQLWEIISRPDIGSVTDEERGPNIGDPTMVSDIAAWHYGFERKRDKEFGRVRLADGTHKNLRGKEGVVGSETRYAAGPPVTVDHIRVLGVPFLDHATGTIKGKQGKRSLWELWYERGTGLKDLPWMDTEDPKDWVGVDQEVAPHSFNGWLYQRFNAATAMEWLTKWSVSVPELLKVGDDGKLIMEKVVKAFDKTFGDMEHDAFKRAKKRLEEGDRWNQFEPFTVENMENPNLRGKIDPRAIAVMGWITQKHPDGSGGTLGDDGNRPLPDYLRFVPGDSEKNGIGRASSSAFQDSVVDLLRACMFHGFIDKNTVAEIVKYCRLGDGSEMAEARNIYRSLGISKK